MANKIVIYIDTPDELSEQDAVGAVLKLMNDKSGLVVGGFYKISDNDIATVIENKKSITFRIVRVKNG